MSVESIARLFTQNETEVKDHLPGSESTTPLNSTDVHAQKAITTGKKRVQATPLCLLTLRCVGFNSKLLRKTTVCPCDPTFGMGEHLFTEIMLTKRRNS